MRISAPSARFPLCFQRPRCFPLQAGAAQERNKKIARAKFTVVAAALDGPENRYLTVGFVVRFVCVNCRHGVLPFLRLSCLGNKRWLATAAGGSHFAWLRRQSLPAHCALSSTWLVQYWRANLPSECRDGLSLKKWECVAGYSRVILVASFRDSDPAPAFRAFTLLEAYIHIFPEEGFSFFEYRIYVSLIKSSSCWFCK